MNFHFLLNTVITEGIKHYLLPQLIKYRDTCREKFGAYFQDTLQAALLYNFDALLFYLKADYNNALEFYNKSLENYKKCLEPDHQDIATTYSNMALVYYRKGEYETLLKYYNDC